MFRNTRRKRLRNRVIAAAAGVVVMTFGIWLNYNIPEEEQEVEKTVQEVVVDKENEVKNTKDNKQQQLEDDVSVPSTYLIKEENGTVKVYLCDDEGNKELYLITSIPYDLLSESDQQLFKKGVILDTEEDLGKFLENFDS